MKQCSDLQDAGLLASSRETGGGIRLAVALSGMLALTLFLNGCAIRKENFNDVESAGPEIYDPHADGAQQLVSALAEAKVRHKRVLLSLGANWCSDSQSMFRLLQNDPRIVHELKEHYVLAMVDVNKTAGPDRNAPLVARLGDPLARGIPVLLVLGADGTVLNADPTERLTDSDHQHPEKVFRYLHKWSGQPESSR